MIGLLVAVLILCALASLFSGEWVWMFLCVIALIILGLLSIPDEDRDASEYFEP